ncbi:MAG: hypothetical protein ACI4WG_04845 [Erysipelotrichaceae bacterium]
MNNLNREIVKIINKLQDYAQIGYMNKAQIQQLIADIQNVYSQQNLTQFNKMMEDITQYYTEISKQDDGFEEFVKNNIDEVASVLQKSVRTIYRKLQNKSFTLVEKKTIIRGCHVDDRQTF